MKTDNASIIIDVVMGELQKKNEFSTKLSKVAESAIADGMAKASKVRKTALNEAIIKGVYTETPASKRAVRKLAKGAIETINKEVENYNKKNQYKGGFWNTVGSFMVNTGILRFGQGYKGGNFVKDRHFDTSKTMDKTGKITETSHLNYGRVGGDLLSVGTAIFNATQMLAQIVSNGFNRIEKDIEEGQSNVQEVQSIARTIGYKGTNLKPLVAGVNTMDVLSKYTNYSNLGTLLTNYFSKEEGQKLARLAGFRGMTAFDMATEWIEALRDKSVWAKNKDGSYYRRKMTVEEKQFFEKMAPVFGTPNLITQLTSSMSGIEGYIFGPNGQMVNGQDTLYTRNLKNLENLSVKEYNNYMASMVNKEIERKVSLSNLTMGEKSRYYYKGLNRINSEEIDREIKRLSNAEEFIEAYASVHGTTEKLVDSINTKVAKLVNFFTNRGEAGRRNKEMLERINREEYYRMAKTNKEVADLMYPEFAKGDKNE